MHETLSLTTIKVLSEDLFFIIRMHIWSLNCKTGFKTVWSPVSVCVLYVFVLLVFYVCIVSIYNTKYIICTCIHTYKNIHFVYVYMCFMHAIYIHM